MISKWVKNCSDIIHKEFKILLWNFLHSFKIDLDLVAKSITRSPIIKYFFQNDQNWFVNYWYSLFKIHEIEIN